MIKIEHKDLENIQKTYSKNVLAEFNRRIDVLKRVINLLKSTTPVVDNDVNWNEDRTALKAVLGASSISVNKKTLLINCFNNNRNTILILIRIGKIENDLTEISNSISDILSKKPNDLLKLQNEIDSNTSLLKNDLLIKYLFNYEYYYDDFIAPIAEKLDLGVCPYCNRNYITHIPSKKGGRIIGPTFDHFFDKGKNPFLALSFYNLIPSCSVCNSNLKNQKTFKLDIHLHPYLDCPNKDFSFDFNLDLLGKSSKSKIIFKPIIKYNVSEKSPEYKRLKGDGSKDSGSINVFKIKEIYEKHYDVVEEIHEKFDKNSRHYLKSIKSHLDIMGVSEKEFYRYHFGNYYNKEEFHKRPLAKLTKDIYEKMKCISPLNK